MSTVQHRAQVLRSSPTDSQNPPLPTGLKPVARLLVSLGGLRLRNDVNHRGRQKLSPSWRWLQSTMRAQVLASSALFSGINKARDNFREGIEEQQRQAVLRAEGLAGSRTCVLTMDETRGDQKARYIDQGDEEMYTQESLDQRYSIRHDAKVAALLRAWWRACMRLNKERLFPHGKLFEAEYCAVFEKVYKVMMPIRDYDATKAAIAVKDDWKSDAKGKRFMDEHAFMDALFELADVWTQTTDASEYAAFLEQLLLRVTAKKGEFLDLRTIKAGSMQPSDWDTALVASQRTTKNLLAERGFIDGHNPNRQPERPPARNGRALLARDEDGDDAGEWYHDGEGRRRRARDERHHDEEGRRRALHDGTWRAGGKRQSSRYGWMAEGEYDEGGRGGSEGAWRVGVAADTGRRGGGLNEPSGGSASNFFEPSSGGFFRAGRAAKKTKEQLAIGVGTKRGDIPYTGVNGTPAEHGGCAYSGSGADGGPGAGDGSSAYGDALRALCLKEEEAKLRQRSAVALQSAARRRKATKKRGRLTEFYLPQSASEASREALVAALPACMRLYGLSARLQGLGGIKHVYYDATQPRKHNAATRAQPGHNSCHVAYRRAIDAGVGGDGRSKSPAPLLTAPDAPQSRSPPRSPSPVARPRIAAASNATPASALRAATTTTPAPPLPSRRGTDSPWAGAPLLVHLSRPAPARRPLDGGTRGGQGSGAPLEATRHPKPAPHRPLSGSAVAALPHQMLARTSPSTGARGVAYAATSGAALRRAFTAPLGAAPSGGNGWKVLALEESTLMVGRLQF